MKISMSMLLAVVLLLFIGSGNLISQALPDGGGHTSGIQAAVAQGDTYADCINPEVTSVVMEGEAGVAAVDMAAEEPGVGGGDGGDAAGGAPPPAPADTTTTERDTDDAVDATVPDAGSPRSEDAQANLPLNAGEINDNADWDNFLLYRRDFSGTGIDVHDVDVTGRHIINVIDGQGLPVLGARVEVYAGDELVSSSRTYANGQTLFFPNAVDTIADSYRVVVSKGDVQSEFTLEHGGGQVSWDVVLEDYQRSTDTVRLDVLFLIDATGSMGDEIFQMQSNILAISEQIAALPADVDVRYALVIYRDRTDNFVVQSCDFTPNVDDFQAALNRVQASGGGDYAESLNEGIHAAIHAVEWRGGDAIQMIFLVADAPPHLDYQDDYDYAQEMVEAARRGIKIHPIASSGLDAQGEYVFRQIAQYTMGNFIFLTYEGGQPGRPGDERPDLEAGGEDFTVESLDDLVLRLIVTEIADWRAE